MVATPVEKMQTKDLAFFCLFVSLCWISSLMLFLFSFVLFLIMHRHNCIIWVKAAHQLPLFIDLFIFIYLYRKKQGAQFMSFLWPESNGRDSRHVHLDGEKDLEEHERDSFWIPGGHYSSCKTATRIEMPWVHRSGTTNGEVEEDNSQSVMSLTFTLVLQRGDSTVPAMQVQVQNGWGTQCTCFLRCCGKKGCC